MRKFTRERVFLSILKICTRRRPRLLILKKPTARACGMRSCPLAEHFWTSYISARTCARINPGFQAKNSPINWYFVGSPQADQQWFRSESIIGLEGKTTAPFFRPKPISQVDAGPGLAVQPVNFETQKHRNRSCQKNFDHKNPSKLPMVSVPVPTHVLSFVRANGTVLSPSSPMESMSSRWHPVEKSASSLLLC